MSLLELDGKAIRIGRALRGLSQRELGQACGMTLWQIWQIENGVRRLRPEEVVKILGALSITPEAKDHNR
jgi:transcriptional regulator with XRE-family HTH domain